jgi:diaminopimelate epimerase
MNQINFCKFHGFGNDYIVFEAEKLKNVASLSDFAVAVCHRNTGVGGDGIAVLEKLGDQTRADFLCRIINPDGSEAGFSGNGTRCAVAYLHFKNLWNEKNLRLQTKSGVKNYEFLRRENNTFWFRAELGRPDFNLPDSPFLKSIAAETGQNEATGFSALMLPEEKMVINFLFVDVGNPVTCIFLEDFNALDWRRVGRRIECLREMFPDRTNVVFIRKINADNIEIRIWERGAGETSSSGTCSIAAAVAHLTRENRRGAVQVAAVGGTTEAAWREDGEMLITGRADLAFCGEFYL